MRRLVGISSRTQKAIMASMALLIACTSVHMAAAARVASLRRQQERFEQLIASAQPGAVSQGAAGNAIPAVHPVQAASVQPPPFAAQELTARAPAAVGRPATAHKRQIIISIADRKLALLEDGQVLKTYPIAVGMRRTPSPEGDFVIVNHAKDPTYRHRDKEIAPGKDNPLGTRWMGLSLKGYGIHGTNVQSSVGKAASHGCFRMRKQDVEELYTLVRVGDAVMVRRERDVFVARVFDAPSAPVEEMTAKLLGNAEVASATVTTVETAQE